MNRILCILLWLCLAFSASAVDVTHCGVVGDGKVINTAFIQHVIDSVSNSGGGEIYFPQGKYLTGTLFLKDNVTLNLEKGAVILGSTDLADYPIISTKYVSHVNRYTNRCLIYAEEANNISIKGEGIIDGQGEHEHFKADIEDPLLSIILRPYVLRFVSCVDVRILGIDMRNSAAWMQHYLDCENLYIEGITVVNHVNYNNDGIDVDNCRNVRILNCRIDTDDDAICFKTTNSIDTCANIVVANCIIGANCNAIKFGTETNGGFRNIAISNCVFYRPNNPTHYSRPHRALGGIVLEVVDGAEMNGITINNISMDGVMTPLFIRLADRGRNFYDGGPRQSIGTLKNITISNVTASAYGAISSSITAVPGAYVENVMLENIRIIHSGGGTQEEANSRNIPEMIADYPETLMFAGAPACGLFVRHVKGLIMGNMYLETLKEDSRAMIYMEDVANCSLSDYIITNPSLEANSVVCRDVQNIQIETRLDNRKKVVLENYSKNVVIDGKYIK